MAIVVSAELMLELLMPAFRLMPRRASAQLKMRARGGSPESSPSPESTSADTASREGTPSPSDSVADAAFSDHPSTPKAERKDTAAKQKQIDTRASAPAATASGSVSSLPARIALRAQGERSPERKLSGYGILPDSESDTEPFEDGHAGVKKTSDPCLNLDAADSLVKDLERCCIGVTVERHGPSPPAAADVDVNQLVQRMATLEHKVDALKTENEDLKRSVILLASEAEAARAR